MWTAPSARSHTWALGLLLGTQGAGGRNGSARADGTPSTAGYPAPRCWSLSDRLSVNPPTRRRLRSVEQLERVSFSPVPLPQGNEALNKRSSTAHCPKATCTEQKEFHCPLPQGNEALNKRSSTAHCPKATCTEQKEFHCPLPQGNEALNKRSSTAHCPKAVRH